MQQSQTAHLPAFTTDSSVVVQGVPAMAPWSFRYRSSRLLAHQRPLR